MKKLVLLALFFAPSFSFSAVTEQFTEFYCNNSGNNKNAGSTVGTTTYWDNAGNWYSTGSYTHVGVDLSGVSVGQVASIYRTQDSTTSFIGVITFVDDTTDEIYVSLASASFNGTVLASSVAPGIEIRVGGAWRGPNGNQAIPINFISSAPISTTAFPRVNFLASSSFSVTVAMTHSKNGPVRFQGYTTTPGDGGMATMDGNGVGASIAILTVSGGGNEFYDMIFSSNGTSGSSNLLTNSGVCNLFRRIIIYNSRGHCFNNSQVCTVEQSEVYRCNTSNTAALGGLSTTNQLYCDRVISHHNTGSNASGFVMSNGAASNLYLSNCIAAENGNAGANIVVRAGRFLAINFSAYKNGSHGIAIRDATSQGVAHIISPALFDNTGAGISYTKSNLNSPVEIENAVLGSGTQANSGGDIVGVGDGIGSIENTIIFSPDRTPWVSPDTGNFTINSNEIAETGIGSFTMFQSTYTGTTSYPSSGATQPRQKRGGYAITQ